MSPSYGRATAVRPVPLSTLLFSNMDSKAMNQLLYGCEVRLLWATPRSVHPPLSWRAGSYWLPEGPWCMQALSPHFLTPSLILFMPLPFPSSSSKPPRLTFGTLTSKKAGGLGFPLTSDSLGGKSRLSAACCASLPSPAALLLGIALFHLSLTGRLRIVYLLTGPSRLPIRYNQANRD